MSQENVAALLEGEATVYRGREEVREMFHDYFEVFADLRFEISEMRDLGDRILAVGDTLSGDRGECRFAWEAALQEETRS